MTASIHWSSAVSPSGAASGSTPSTPARPDAESVAWRAARLLSPSVRWTRPGQRQRLLIARAIVHKPRLLLFDEATSALDNRTQEIVGESLERLAVTRLVIAHRLSTIVKADRIYVLERGRIVESGTYRELMQRRGVFAALARRQVA